MKIKGKKIAFGITSPFYTFKYIIIEIERIVKDGGIVIPIMSTYAYSADTKYGKAKNFVNKIENITNRKIINSVGEAEEVEADIMVIAPCSRK